MANQSLAADFALLPGIWALPGLAISLCSISRRPNPPTVDAGGWPDYTGDASGYQPVAALQNIPCQLSIWRMKPDIAAVTRSQDRFDTLAERHALLNAGYTGILQRDICTIDGVVYEIMSVEQPSQTGQTRLALRMYVI
jgi:hypothetical protein